MPRPRKAKLGKSQKLSGKAKDIQASQLRLMQISLKLDDHVYKNKLISTEHAETYLQEIKVLKAQCHQDMRLLQVVEKLTRVMRQIIAEVENSNTNTGDVSQNNLNRNETSIDDYSIEPSEKTVAGLDTINPENSVETVDLSADNIEVNEKDCTEEIKKQNETVTEVSRALSNLSVNDVVIPENTLNIEAAVEDSCAQGYGEYERFMPNEHAIAETPMMDTSNSLPMVNITDNLPASTHYASENADKALNQNDKFYSNNIAKVLINENIPLKSIETEINALETTEKDYVKPIIRETKDSKKIISNAHVNKKKNTDANAKPKKRKFNPPINKHEMKKTSKGVNKKKQTKTETISMEDNNKIIPGKQPVINSNKDSSVSKTMEIDLSWVENIKYVRQIDKTEYSLGNNLAETFWDSCEFPSNWTDNEFN